MRKSVTIRNEETGDETQVQESSVHVWTERGWTVVDDEGSPEEEFVEGDPAQLRPEQRTQQDAPVRDRKPAPVTAVVQDPSTKKE